MSTPGCKDMPLLSQRLARHFGVPLYRIEPMLVRMAIALPALPDWLRGRRRLDQLPRYDDRAQGHVVNLERLEYFVRALRLAWVVDNLHDAWRFAAFERVDGVERLVPVLVLTSDRDIVLYRLHWAGRR